jgi:protein TonB
MFDQVFETPAVAGRACSTMAGFAAQGVLLTAAVLVPLMFPDALPRVRSAVDVFSAPGPPPPPALPLKTTLVRTGARPVRASHILIEPTAAPARAMIFVDAPPAALEAGTGGVEGGVPGGVEGGVPGGIPTLLSDVMNAFRPAPPPPRQNVAPAPKAAAAAAPPVRIVSGGDVQEARMIHRVIPVYPALARQARISGKVELHGVIGIDGRIRELRVRGGHPLLIPAALEAVRQWVYRPTLLNGVPVEVEAPITVNFMLSGMN